ncbi:MAG: right-handed parallel beta-helix repeat-containing protein [Deltaproteobacteria bacterium]|nr:right-handed parallel beta-helix repeat-containing protein [Deltaproteobacteria bacterium]
MVKTYFKPAWATEASYVIYKVGDEIRGMNGRHGHIDVRGTDAATVINKVFALLTPGRTAKEKVVLKGSFELSGPLEIPSFTVLDLRNASLKLADGADCRMIENSDQVAGNSDIEIFGGLLDGNKSNQTTGHALVFTLVSKAKIVGTEIKDSYDNAITLDRCSDLSIEGCFIGTAGAPGSAVGYGIYSRGAAAELATSIRVRNCRIVDSKVDGISIAEYHRDVIVEGNAIQGTTDTAIVIKCQGGTVANNQIRGVNGTGIIVDSYPDTEETTDVNVVGNQIYGSDPNDGIRIGFAADRPTRNITCVGNVVGGTTRFAYYINYVDNVTIAGVIGRNSGYGLVATNATQIQINDCVFHHNSDAGISIDDTCSEVEIIGTKTYNNAYHGIRTLADNTVISGCQCWNNGTAATHRNGIQIDNALNCVVVGCRCWDIDGVQDYGVGEGGTSDYTLLDGCNLRGNAIAGHTVDATNSVVGDVIT